jgi:hypothetical protein
MLRPTPVDKIWLLPRCAYAAAQRLTPNPTTGMNMALTIQELRMVVEGHGGTVPDADAKEFRGRKNK